MSRRQRDDLDRRNVLVQKTANGAGFLTEFSRLIDAAKLHIAGIPAQLVEFAIESEAAAAEAYAAPAEMWARNAAE